MRELIEATAVIEEEGLYAPQRDQYTPEERRRLIARLRREMQDAARELAFEKAARLRDLIFDLERDAPRARSGKV